MKRPKQETTERRIERYYSLKALLDEWETQPDDVQIRNHAYILRLKAKVRQERAYIEHRNDPAAHL
jgi:hypothetical protein